MEMKKKRRKKLKRGGRVLKGGMLCPVHKYLWLKVVLNTIKQTNKYWESK
jgi:hypothetical protein